MRDAIGGTVTIVIISFFILLVNGYLAFNVNYTKAFRVKSEIISIIEENEGHTTHAQSQIAAYLQSMNYGVSQNMTSQVASDSNYTCTDYGYCVAAYNAGVGTYLDEGYEGTYYHVITFVNMDIPILAQVLPLLANQMFQVDGETKTIYSFGTNTETTP